MHCEQIPPAFNNMQTIKMLRTGEVLQVTKNDAHALIDSGQAVLVKQVTAQTYEPQRPAELGQTSGKTRLRQRGKYLIK